MARDIVWLDKVGFYVSVPHRECEQSSCNRALKFGNLGRKEVFCAKALLSYARGMMPGRIGWTSRKHTTSPRFTTQAHHTKVPSGRAFRRNVAGYAQTCCLAEWLAPPFAREHPPHHADIGGRSKFWAPFAARNCN